MVNSRPWFDAFRTDCRPKDPLTVSQWADRYRVIPRGTSPEPGPWRTGRAPYLREILDAISDPTINTIVVQAGSQLGKTEILLCAIGYYADQEPAPILIVQANEDAMRDFSKERIGTLFASTPVLRGKLSEGERDPKNTIMSRTFPGGYLACAWAGSAASLASRPIRILMGDEIDRWPDTTGRDGDPWSQAVQRTQNFHNKKIIAVSTPTIAGASAINRMYESTDRREFYVPCPRCGVLHVMRWRNIRYKNAAGAIDLDDIHYVCSECGERVEEREKAAMVAAGGWQPRPLAADEPKTDPARRGYHMSAIVSPWVRWRDLAMQWIEAHANRDNLGKQAFINLKLGETWREDTASISVESLEKNREAYVAEVPDDVLVLTAGVDVQDNRLEAEVVGWGIGKQSWGIEYVIIPGDTSDMSAAGPWTRLDTFLARSWAKADGRAYTIRCAFIDSGGHRTSEVYEFCRARVFRAIYASKGSSKPGTPIVNKPSTTNQARINLFPIGTEAGKQTVYSRLAIATAGPGYCHFPIDRGYDDQFFKGLVAEQLVSKRQKDGRVKRTWIVTGGRNEPLDIRVLATAALEALMPDVEGMYDYLPKLAAEEAKARGVAASSPTMATAARPARRRVLSKGVDG